MILNFHIPFIYYLIPEVAANIILINFSFFDVMLKLHFLWCHAYFFKSSQTFFFFISKYVYNTTIKLSWRCWRGQRWLWVHFHFVSKWIIRYAVLWPLQNLINGDAFILFVFQTYMIVCLSFFWLKSHGWINYIIFILTNNYQYFILSYLRLLNNFFMKKI